MFKETDFQFDESQTFPDARADFFSGRAAIYNFWLVIFPDGKRATIIHDCNVFLNKDKRIFAFDFGAAKIVEIDPEERVCWIEKV